MLQEIRIDKLLRAFSKPPLVRVNSIKLEQNDVLVVCAGFEDRITACLKNAINNSENIFNVLIVNYLPFIADNKNEEILGLCRAHDLIFKIVTYNREDPSGVGADLLKSLPEKCGNIFIDISGMSRLLIVQVLCSLSCNVEYYRKSCILYSEALDYPPTEQEVQDALKQVHTDINMSVMFLSSGVFNVMVAPELTSVALQGQPTRLIFFPSFNTDQFTALRAELQPSYLSIIHGIPPDKKNLWRLKAISVLNHIGNLPNCDEYEACTLDYKETLEVLLKIYDQYGTLEKIVVAPTGSKMQSVAVGLLRTFMNDIQIVFPMERSFESKNYTKGVKQIYKLSLSAYSDLLKDARCSED